MIYAAEIVPVEYPIKGVQTSSVPRRYHSLGDDLANTMVLLILI